MAARGQGQRQQVQSNAALQRMVDQLSARIDRAMVAKKPTIAQGAPAARGNRNRPVARRRTQAQLRRNAQLRSIPRALPSQQQQFSQGALRTNAFAPRGQGYYDAFAQHPDSTILASGVGPCTPIEGYAHTVIRGTAPVTGDYLNYQASDRSDGQVDFASLIGSLPTAGDNSVLVIMNPGSSDDIIGCVYRLKLGNASSGAVPPVVVGQELIRASQFSDLQHGDAPNHNSLFHVDAIDGVAMLAHDSTGRTESIPLRGSFRMRNITENFSVGGEVRVMRYNGGINLISDIDGGGNKGNMLGRNDLLAQIYDHFHGTHTANKEHESSTRELSDIRNFAGVVKGDSPMIVPTYLEICDMMRQDKRSMCMNGEQLRNTIQSNTYPADAVRSHTFQCDTSFEESVLVPKYSSFMMLIDNFQSGTSQHNNTYSLTSTVQRAARYRPGTILYGKSFTLPANAAVHARQTQRESDSTPVKLANMAMNAVGALAANPAIQKAGMRLATNGMRMMNML